MPALPAEQFSRADVEDISVDHAEPRHLRLSRPVAGRGHEVRVDPVAIHSPPAVGVAGMPGMAAVRRPGLMAILAMGLETLPHAIEEGGESVAVPVFEGVAAVGEAGASSLVGEDGEVVDEVGVVGPAGGDDAVGVPDVLVVDPGDDVVEPYPQFET
ncbi:MAG: hypothetical protein ABI662_07020 [Dermatophilaceae bacterium]